jgi:hypothetical protein
LPPYLPAMKRCCCLFLLPLLLAGCTSGMDPEDRHFFNRGWMNPKRDIDLDPNFDAPYPGDSPIPNHQHPEKYKGDPFSY